MPKKVKLIPPALLKEATQTPIGKWKTGQSGNPKGRPSPKPFKEAMQALVEGNREALVMAANALMARAMTGDVAALKEVADRLDGKVPSTVGGSTEVGPVRLSVAWKK